MRDKILDFYMNLNNIDSEKGLERYLLFTLSPVIAGFKPSSTITLFYDKDWYKIWDSYKEKFLSQLNLKEISLRKGTKAEIILVYNEEKLLECINGEKNKKFLLSLGYNLKEEIDVNLLRLIERYEENHCPHELGVFLGIPIEDVIDFMECSEKKCLMCGYWKVFNNYDEAKDVFEKYDISKEKMILSIERKKSLKAIINEFNKYFKIERAV